MPRLPINYNNLSIYKIVCNDITIKDCYVGSTTNFTKRKSRHKSSCNNSNSLVYITIRSNGGWDNWSMIEIIKQVCVDSNAARRLEREYIELLQANLNSNRPIISADETKETQSEYRKTHKAEKAEYYQTHKAEKAEYYSEYYQTHKAEIAEYNQTHKAEIAEYASEYRETHKAEIAAKQRARRALLKNITV